MSGVVALKGMRLLAVAVAVLVVACTPAPVVNTSPAPELASPSASPSAEPSAPVSPSPSPSATPSPTPGFEKDPADDPVAAVPGVPARPVVSDAQLAAQAQAMVDAIALPKAFPDRIQLYDPAGQYHAAFGGFQQGTAVLMVGRNAVRTNVVVHEFGHAWHERYMGYDTKIWLEYGKIRGYTDPVRLVQNSDNYLDDWRERFAVDFQWAFNPDYRGQFMPADGYWTQAQFTAFRQFVIALPSR